MADQEQALRDWHRLFGLLLTDFFTDSPFVVEVERDLSMQQQLLDVVVIRKGRGKFSGVLPDGLEELANHNLITFKSHHEALDAWAMKELIGHYVAYRKLESTSTSELLQEDQFRLYAVCARFPKNLAAQVQWKKQRVGVYDCLWGTDKIRVIVAGELPREPQNAPLHLFSATPELIGFGQGSYRRHSAISSKLLGQLFDRLQVEGFTMSYTWKDFERDYVKKYFPRLTLQEQEEVFRTLPTEAQEKLLQGLSVEAQEKLLQGLSAEAQEKLLRTLPPEARLEGLSEEEIRQYLDKIATIRKPTTRKQRRKK
jgi:hypothetical protein